MLAKLVKSAFLFTFNNGFQSQIVTLKQTDELGNILILEVVSIVPNA